MNKLGFVINYASEGVGNAIECNKGQWISNCSKLILQI